MLCPLNGDATTLCRQPGAPTQLGRGQLFSEVLKYDINSLQTEVFGLERVCVIDCVADNIADHVEDCVLDIVCWICFAPGLNNNNIE